MDSMAIVFLFITIVVAFLIIPSTADPDSDNGHIDDVLTKNSTDSNPVVRRRTISRSSMGGSRLSLMNTRFNRRPRKKHLDPEHLMDILGDYFDSDWMSVDKPQALSNESGDQGVTYMVHKSGWQYQDMTRTLKNSNLTVELVQIGGEKILQEPNLVSVVEKWLLRKASCPVKYAWEDIGTLFWPRWIKRGECTSVRGTCSWPPGMHCVPTGTSTLHILRWQCRQPRGKGRRKPSKSQSKKDWMKKQEPEQIVLRCHWVRVPYPITNECLCTC